MTPSDLLKIISQGESETVEFKQEFAKTRSANRDIAREIAAFANSQGGYLLIGVQDDGKVVGLQSVAGLEERLMNLASDLVYPPLDLRFEIVEVEGKQVIVVEIPQGYAKPYSPRYIRRGTTKRQATREEERRLFQEGGLVAFDRSPIHETSLSELNAEQLDRYFQRTTGKQIDEFEIDPIRLFINKGILTQDELVTVAGLLMFGDDPQRFLPQSAIKLVRFNGTDPGCDFIDRKEAIGTLLELIEQAIGFVQRNTRQGAKISGLKRIDIPEYLPEVVREAVVNAVVHRDYSIRTAYISVFIFDNRLEIRSPGGLPNAASLELLPFGDHHPRNPLLFLLIEALGYGERVGTGIPRMIRRCRDASYATPKFQEWHNAFWVTLIGKQLDD